MSIAILVAIGAFVIGNRWGSITSYLLNDKNPVSVSSAMPDNLDYSSVEQVYDVLRKNYDGQLDENQLLDGLKAGLARATNDPYTVYLNKEQATSFVDDLNGTFTGIGAELGIKNDQLVIISPLDGFPAQKAGLRAQDIIVAIDDKSALGITVEEAVSKIRGDAGTDVKLTIIRGDTQKDYTITREKIVVPSVNSRIENGIGIIKISRFAEDTVTLANKAATDFSTANVKGIVLDLRNDSGGYLSAAVNVAGLWIDGKPVVQQRRGKVVTHTEKAKKGALLGNIPTVVLINGGSASASEIVAGALQDYKLATLIGETSYGKGSVQELEKLSDGGLLKVTVARWYTPNGNNIDKEGITPDIEVKLSEKDIQSNVDSQLNKALEVLKTN